MDNRAKGQGEKDRHLDVPGEANRDKHINYLEQEEKASQEGSDFVRIDLDTQEDEQRQEQWKQGIEEGKREQRKRSGL